MPKPTKATIRKKDWLLLFLASPREGTDQVPDADPIRIQKGLFLFSMESGVPKNERYEFQPYNYGACSFEIYRDLDALVADGYLERVENQWRSWPFYRVTQKGLEEARRLERVAPQTALKTLKMHKEFTFSHGFLDMLREIYTRYPRYAVRSVLKFS